MGADGGYGLTDRQQQGYDGAIGRGSQAELDALVQPMPAQTDLQRRLQSELDMHHSTLMERRAKGGPEGLGEIDRELTMATGALEGLYQRVGHLAAVLGPVMPGGTVQELMVPSSPSSLPTRLMAHEVETEIGQRIQTLVYAISELEDVIGTFAARVRL